jgi:hypothetical protein
MAGTTWNVFLPNTKIRSSEFNENFDWLNGSIVPMNAGSMTDSAYDLGTSANKWNNIFGNNILAINGIYFDTASASAPDRIEVTNHSMDFYTNNSVTAFIDNTGLKIANGKNFYPNYSMPTTFINVNAPTGTMQYYVGDAGHNAGTHQFYVNSVTMAQINPSNTSFYVGTRFYASGATLLMEVNGTGTCIQSGKKLFFDGGGDSYMQEDSANHWLFRVGGTTCFELNTTTFLMDVNLNPTGLGILNQGGGTAYWGEINYKDLTDRGCLGSFDEGVELQDGSIVSDTEAILTIKKHPTKKTIYGVAMLDYKTFPKVSYKPATNEDGELLQRDGNDEPINGSDGVGMTSMFSIILGAIKELTLRVKKLEAK